MESVAEELVSVIGGGLAGSECAFQLCRRGIPVKLWEMKPQQRSPAHRTDGLAELVCSNSFRSDNPENAIGLLHWELRAAGSAVPILMLTARDAVADRVRGLDTGADDYLTKPFDLHELLARVRALLRRGPAVRTETIQLANLTIDTLSRRACRAGRTIELTGKEYALLDYLARHAEQVVGRAEIAEHVWDQNFDPFSNLIEVYIQRLRRKIDDGHSRKLLHTIRGGGYMLSSQEGVTGA